MQHAMTTVKIHGSIISILTLLVFSGAGAILGLPTNASADSVNVDFESYTTGTVDAQDGWTSTGAAGSGCALYDHAIGGSLDTAGFGSQSLRVSNAVTSGCFGDQTFSKPLVNAVGETGAGVGTYSAGALRRNFEMEFDIISAVPTTQQPGLFMSVSPDRGDGSRMSYVGFSDDADGITINFYDVQGTGTPANFVATTLGTYDRSISHNVKLTFEAVNGPSNDVVKVFVDGALAHTGTSWENYYRFDTEASAEQNVRIVRTVLFRTGGSAIPATAGNGFLIDNISLASTNVAPVAFDQTVLVKANSIDAAITLSADDTENDELTALLTAVSHGTLEGEAPFLFYTPTTDYYGTDPFTFTVNDGDLTSNTATVSIIVYMDPVCPEGANFIGGDLDKCLRIIVDPENPENTTTEFLDPTCAAGVFTPAHDVCENDTPTPVTCEAGFHLEENVCVADTVTPPSGGGGNSGGSNNGGGSSGGGGGGGGGGSSTPTTPVATTTGQVLGVSTGGSCYKFALALGFGMRGAEILELQKALAAKGFLIATPNGNFGPATLAAVKAYQAANGLEQVGTVGPKTRALLNICVGSANPNQALIDELTKKLGVILEQIKQLLAARGR